MVFAISLAWLAIFAGAWLGWQLLRQNGRLLLRIEALEEFLNELELGEPAAPAGLPFGSSAPDFELRDLQEAEAEGVDSKPESEHSPRSSSAASRFSTQSLARSKIKRAG